MAWWNTLYIDAAMRELQASGMAFAPEVKAWIHPPRFDHINGRCPITRPDLGGDLRALREPADDEDG